MDLKLGERIRQLRKKESRTQEELAEALGVTNQAVSRWETNGAYPDMEMIPAIANYFGVSIDDLFGYHGERDRKVRELIARVDTYQLDYKGNTAEIDECITLLRAGLAEFPGNERILFKLAQVLSIAGWRRHQEWVYYDDEGYHRHDYDRHRDNPYWAEAITLYEKLISSSVDHETVAHATAAVVQLYRNLGETEKAVALANQLPELKYSRELVLAGAADGKKEAAYIGDALMKMAVAFTEQYVYGLINNQDHFRSDYAIGKIKSLIGLFHLICDDGNLGACHEQVSYLYLYLSRLQWERGYHDEAFGSLDQALLHAKAFDSIAADADSCYTAPLVRFVKCHPHRRMKLTPELPDTWPMWCNPDYAHVAKEIKADPRWAEWCSRTQSEFE